MTIQERIEKTKSNGIRFRAQIKDDPVTDGYTVVRGDLRGGYYHQESFNTDTMEAVLWAYKPDTSDEVLDKIRRSDTPVLEFLEEREDV